MKGNLEERCVLFGRYIAESGATVRACAAHFKISKSTVYQDVAARLRLRDPVLHRLVKAVLEKNKQERHLRGGMATKNKYLCKKEKASHG